MISVETALDEIFKLVAPTEAETVPLRAAAGRVLASEAVARRDQPPFAASAMDGYALRGAEALPGARFSVIGAAPAGQAFEGAVGPGQAVRILTGGAIPDGADRVVIQEDVTRDGDEIVLGARLDPQPYIRPAGGDFQAGTTLRAPRRLGPADISLLASMNIAEVSVHSRPRVAIIATGDELVMPGEVPRHDQIVCSNSFGLAAMGEAEGASARILPIARDTVDSLQAVLDLARDADLILTTGGASVGDHDVLSGAADTLGLKRSFYKVAMRPGKPLMAGRLDRRPLIGLPGNPVSSMVCGTIFVLPALRGMMGLPHLPAPRQTARLGIDLDANGAREHYMRGHLEAGIVTPFPRQDSSLQRVLAEANALVVRAAHAPALAAGSEVEIVAI